MRERDKGATIEVASLKAGMTRRTGSKYLKTGKLPSDRNATRDWRTRPDPFKTDWPVVELRSHCSSGYWSRPVGTSRDR